MKRRAHRYLLTLEHGGYVWSCSCGDYDLVPTTYRSARAAVKRHLAREKAKKGKP